MHHASKGQATHFRKFFAALGIVIVTGMWVIQCDDSTSPAASAPAAPALVSPADLGTAPSDSTILTWSASAGATSYQLQLSVDSAYGSFLVNDSELITKSRWAGPLSAGKTYYWRVRAKNDAGVSAWSARRFVTAALATETALTITAPKTGESFPLNGPIVVKWHVNTDTLNASNIHSYLKQFTLDSGKSWHDMTVLPGSEITDSNKYQITWIGLDTTQFKCDTCSTTFSKADFLNKGVKLQVISYPPNQRFGYTGFITFHE